MTDDLKLGKCVAKWKFINKSYDKHTAKGKLFNTGHDVTDIFYSIGDGAYTCTSAFSEEVQKKILNRYGISETQTVAQLKDLRKHATSGKYFGSFSSGSPADFIVPYLNRLIQIKEHQLKDSKKQQRAARKAARKKKKK